MSDADPIMQYFKFEHLAGKLQAASKPFCELAQRVVETLPRNPERTVALRKLLEAKDAAVRAALTVALLVFLFPLAALAQTSASPAEPDLAGLLKLLLESIQSGNGWAIAGVVVSLLTWGLRAGLLDKLPEVARKWLYTNPLIATATPFVLSAIGGVITTFASGEPFTVMGLLTSVLKVGATAVTTFIVAKKIAESRQAGAAAAAEIDSKPKALELLGKGPQP